MRALLLLLLATSTVAASPKASDPPLLGVMFTGNTLAQPGAPAPLGCMVTGVTPSSGAEAAGIRTNEIIVKIEGAVIASCDRLVEVVTSHAIGESLSVELASFASATSRKVSVQLSSRAEIARRDLLGKPIDTELVSTEDRDELVLGALRGRPVIIGWFSADCALECKAVFDKVAAFQRKSTKISALAVTQRPGFGQLSQQQLTGLRDTYKLDVPLAIVAPPVEPTTPLQSQKASMMFDRERVMFTLIDVRGNVTYVSPVAPTAEDLDAVLEDLFVAADQAARRK